MDYSLMFPQNANQSYKTLTPESVVRRRKITRALIRSKI